MTPLHLHRPTEADIAFAHSVLACETSTRPQLLEACDTLASSPDWMDRELASEMRNVFWADRASELLPQARDLAERLARNQVPDVMSWPGDFDGKHDTPRFAGLQQGDVRQRWIDRQPPVDRWIFRAVIAVTAFGAAIGLALIWGAL